MTFKVTLMFTLVGLLLAVAQTKDTRGPKGETENDNDKGVYGYFGPGKSDKTPGNADNKGNGDYPPFRKVVLEVPGRFGQGNSDKTLGYADDDDDDRWRHGKWGPGHWGPGNWGPGNNGKWPGWHHDDHDDDDDRHHHHDG